MNLSYLKYAVEVEKTGSITKAAQNYYMNQPHLSKIIRELERDLGCPIFDRTSRGMIPTVRGEEFLRYAKGIMEQEAQLDKLCSRNKECPREIRLCGPRASYISSTLKNFLKEDDRLFTTNVRYKETNSKDVVRLVSSKEFDLGIVRCQVLYEPFFLKMIQDEHLDSKVLWQFSPKVLMSPSHPLAGNEPLDHLDFSQSVELLQGDIQYPSFTPENTDCVLPDSDPRHTIYIYDRGSQYEFLRHLPGAYMWTSPVPYSTLTEAKLIQRECTRPDNVFKDLLVCRSNYRLSKAETELTQWLGRTISQLSD